MLPEGYREATAKYLFESRLSSEYLRAFKASAEAAGKRHIDIPDVPGVFAEGVLWKAEQRAHGVLRIPVAVIDEVLEAENALDALLA